MSEQWRPVPGWEGMYDVSDLGRVGYRNLLPVIVKREGATLPDGCDAWGIKSVRLDLRTYGGYQWPFPGGVAECDPVKIVTPNNGACPEIEGDGLCVATDWEKMSSGGLPARTLLLVAYASADVLGHDCPRLGSAPDKLRVSKVHVVAVVDGERLIREAGLRANLQGANLRGANLQGANLQEADLQRADLQGANLQGANLRGANLQGANLQEADLRGANLRGADLQRADLQRADLQRTDLLGAVLQYANLKGADLQRADLWGADLRYANLQRADLRGADLHDQACANEWTWLPTGYAVRNNQIMKED